MQKIISNEHRVLLYRNPITSWNFFEPQNSEGVPIYEVVLEELGRTRLFYDLNLKKDITLKCGGDGPVFRDDKDNSKAISWMHSQKSFEFYATYDCGTTDVRANSGEMVSIKALFWVLCGIDYFRLHNKSDIWVPVANEFEIYDSEQTEESLESYINKYASENSKRLEECLKSIQHRLSFLEINDSYDIHRQEGFRMYNLQASLEKHFPGTDIEKVSEFSWERREQISL